MKKQLINLEPVKEQIRDEVIKKYNETIYMNTSTIDIKLDVSKYIDEYITSKQLVDPVIYITTEAYLKMRQLVDQTKTEIGWYGVVSEVPGLERTYVIEDIIVYPQTVTGATCVQDEDRMFEFEMSLTDEQVNHKRFHGHSHVNMGVTPSGVDEQFYQDILSQVSDYFIITITNKNSAYTTRFYDVANNIMYSEVPILLLLQDGTTLDVWYDNNITQLSEKVITTQKYNTSIFKSGAPAKKPWVDNSNYDVDWDYLNPEAKQVNEITNILEDEEDPYIYDSYFGYVRRSEQATLHQDLIRRQVDSHKSNKRKGRK